MLLRRAAGTARRSAPALIAVASTIALCAIAATPAHAVLVRLRTGRTLSYQPLRTQQPRRAAPRPLDELFSNVDYNGGPVMPSNTNYTVYWRPPGAHAYTSEYQAGIDRYFSDLAADSGGGGNVDSVAAQYNDAEGHFASYASRFGGELIDEHPYPANGCTHAARCLTDAQIRSELVRFVGEHGLPTDLAHEYFVLTPPNVESCFEEAGEESECSAGSELPSFCAYHGNIPLPTGELVYANDPYVTGINGCDDGNHPNNNAADGALQGGLSHEHNESTTDPEPNSAWTDFGKEPSEVGEIGDKCVREMGPPLGQVALPKGGTANYNQVINGHFYWYQEEWSNQGASCLQRLSLRGPEPTAAFTVAPLGGTELRFDASRSTAPGGVYRYNWQWGDAAGGELPRPTETATPTVTHAFPSPGVYTVALTVFAPDGTSIGTARTFEAGDEPPSAQFAFASASATVAAPVALDASASADPDGSIREYAWSFDDGGAAAGVSAAHAFQTAGAHQVTLTVTDSSRLSASVTRTLEVAPAPTAPLTGALASLPAPPPPQQQLPTGSVTASAGPLTVAPGGRVAIALRCSSSGPACTGRLALTVRRVIIIGGRRRLRTVTIAARGFSIGAGATTRVVLTLTATGRALLRARGGQLLATLVLLKSTPAPAATRHSSLRLRAAHAARRR